MTHIFPIGGGKGGVGKSFISANLGVLMAKRNFRVALVDLDLGGSNLHTFLGVKNPLKGIHTFLDKKTDRLEKTAVPTPFPNLFLISSVNCSIEIANLYHAQKVKLINAIKSMPYDYIILDLGAGSNFNTLDFFLTSENGIIVCTPDPTSIENAFRFIKASYLRRLKHIIKSNNFNKVVRDALSHSGNEQLTSAGIIDLVLRYDRGRELFLRESISRFQFKLILNHFRKNSDDSLGDKIETVCNRHFYSDFEFMGSISFDERIPDSLLSKSLYVYKYPETGASTELKQIANQLVLIRSTRRMKKST